MTRPPVFLSVLVPAHQAEHLLPDTLGALFASDLPRERWELIVIDDASLDRSALVAAEYADTIVRLSGNPHGPGFARNRGFEVSRGDVLVFVDSDVRVAPTALSRIASHFDESPELGSVMGSYDAAPPASGLVSRYRNLLHHYHHHRGAGPASTFWAGLGAIRADVYSEVGGFDEWHYERPQIEDIELGRRISRAGYPILLDPTIQGAHLKRWDFRGMVTTDLMHRGIPWVRLIAREGGGGDTLNVKVKEKLCVALLGLALIAPFLALILGMPALAWISALSIGTIVALNVDLYRFMARDRGFLFGLATIPLHLVYYLVSGMAFAFGQVLHRVADEPEPSERTQRLSSDGVVAWPPIPTRPRTSIWDLRPGGGT